MEKKIKRPDCYKCKYRGEVVGSCHSSCKHPKIEQTEGSLMGLLSVLSGGHMPQVKTKLNVKGNKHGIDSGWFMHPFNFDPVWLEECDGFTSLNN